MPLMHATDACMNSDRVRTRRSGVPTATHDVRRRVTGPPTQPYLPVVDPVGLTGSPATGSKKYPKPPN